MGVESTVKVGRLLNLILSICGVSIEAIKGCLFVSWGVQISPDNLCVRWDSGSQWPLIYDEVKK